MAEKRMFSKKIIDTDWFMDMPASSQNLYFHLSMRADDDGFIASPKRIIKLIGASEDDYKILISKKFVIPFESGICVITDWRINNYLRNDRYTETIYQEEKQKLILNENGKYEFGIPDGIPSIDTNSSSNSNTNTLLIEEKETNKEKDTKRFVKPTLEEVREYCRERNNRVDAERFIDFYTSKGWKVGNQPMKDWKACVRTWEKKNKTESNFATHEFSKKDLDGLFNDLDNVKLV